MDPRRLLSASALALTLAACATTDEAAAPVAPEPVAIAALPEPPALRVIAMAPIPNPPERPRPIRRRVAAAAVTPITAALPPAAAPTEATVTAAVDTPSGDAASALAAIAVAAPASLTASAAYPSPVADEASPPVVEPVALVRPARRRSRTTPAAPVESAAADGRAAIARANARAREASSADAFENGVQVFAFEPGRLYEVWSAPYRVSTLTLAPGETVVSKAAGDTVRWQIGETTSGSGPAQRTHVFIKPLERGLETNLVLTTSERVYMLMLRSGGDDAFNAAIAWRYPDAGFLTPAVEPAPPLAVAATDPASLDGRYRIEPRLGLLRRRPAWTPTAVVNDGVRTLITLPPEAEVDETPVLFVLAPDGEAQVVNYRQQGSVLVVDRLFERAELRLGDRRPQVVRLTRLAAGKDAR